MIASFYGLKVGGNTEAKELQHVVGMVLVFSVGSLLYVVTMHILPEVFPKTAHQHYGVPEKQVESARKEGAETVEPVEQISSETKATSHQKHEDDQKFKRPIQLVTMLIGAFAPMSIHMFH